MGDSSAPSVPVSTGSVISAASSPKAGGSISGGGGGTGSPCAACKFLRRKCQPGCVFAPYFPPDNPQKFVHVHRVFGASNVTKILNDLYPGQREDAVNSLAYEADMRLRDPVYGCVGVISVLQHRLRLIQQDLARARYELSKYQVLYCCWVYTRTSRYYQCLQIRMPGRPHHVYVCFTCVLNSDEYVSDPAAGCCR
jgi:hypothetical protein